MRLGFPPTGGEQERPVLQEQRRQHDLVTIANDQRSRPRIEELDAAGKAQCLLRGIHFGGGSVEVVRLQALHCPRQRLQELVNQPADVVLPKHLPAVISRATGCPARERVVLFWRECEVSLR